MKLIITVCENGHKIWNVPYTKDGKKNIFSFCPRCNGKIIEKIEVEG